uniref:ATP-binding cassette sub-family C member 9-like n=1 Tax=Saccoglossus kowalevskii TaxID=10224 RepID=A0ABM0MS53_SACKO|nr:PREDICTED: ATP-binding cassette sub-family C member 9-like [Saccoglossus kowalevskii]
MAVNSTFKFEWMCGANDKEYAVTEGRRLKNDCFVHAVIACIHLVFCVIIPVVLVLLGRFTSLRLYYSRALIPYPGHTIKWLLVMSLFIILLVAVGEGILTDITRHDTTQPHLYIPQILACISAILSLVYYHHMEYWNQPRLAWLLLTYWIFAIFGESIQLVNLTHKLEFDVTILRLDLTLLLIIFYCSCVCVEINLIRCKVWGWLYEEKPYPRDLKNQNMRFVYNYTNILSRVAFWSLNWVFILGYKKPLQLSDLGCLPDESSSKNIHRAFEAGYEKERERAARKKNGIPSVWRTYIRVYGVTILQCLILKLIADTLGFIPPIAVGGVVTYAAALYSDVEPDQYITPYITVNEFFSNGFVLLGVIFLAVLAKSLFQHQALNNSVFQSVNVRSALQSFTYEKSLRLSSWALSSGERTVGQITNHMSVDAMALQFFCFFQIFFWTIPYQLVVILILLYLELGVASLIGASVFLIATPLQYKIANIMSNVQRSVLKYSDQRMKKSNELLQGIKLLKLYGWEELFSSAIETVRTSESFAVYSAVSPTPLTPELAFSSLALFNQLIIPLVLLPNAIGFFVSAIASTARLQQFFIAIEIEQHDDGRQPLSRGYDHSSIDDDNECSDEYFEQSDTFQVGNNNQSGDTEQTTPNNEYYEEKHTDPLLDNNVTLSYGTFDCMDSHMALTKTSDLPEGVAIKITDGNFAWDRDVDAALLRNINLQIPTGTLTMIVGMVGSGKSSLLSALLKELTTLSGTVQFNRARCKISYGPQKPWLQNVSLRNNIVFGSKFDYKRYQTVLEVCALHPDINILPAGDQTEIGEKGINLSGGQKQRISVARALYSQTDIVLLDDPLSALDVHVGSHLMKEGILGFLKDENRTVILVTHQIQYLRYADQVVVMDDCMISRSGNLKDIQSNDPDMYAEWQQTITMISESEKESECEDDTTKTGGEILKPIISKKGDDIDDNDDETGTLIVKEERETGSVSWAIYLAYAKAIRYPLVLLTLFAYIAQATALILNNFWLAEWSEAGKDSNNKTIDELDDELDYYLRGYAGFSFTYIGLVFVAISFQIIFSLLGAKRLHIKLLRNIVHAPLRFFDTTPVGRILNRLSDDTNLIDQRLWVTVSGILNNTSLCLSAIIVNSVVTPIFLAVVTPVIIGFFVLQKYYLTTSRELQRVTSITRSPVYAHFSETLGGLTTIRAYRDEKRFREYLSRHLDAHNVAQIYLSMGIRWVAVRLELIGAMVILISGLSGLLTSVFVGLEASLISGHLTYLVRLSSDCEMQMNAVERVEYYTNVQPEPYQGTYEPPPTWPDKGTIQLQNISVRYATGLEPVLQDVNITFKCGQKIGICGRTGSGKSSLVLSIFRIIDIFKGHIVIDGVDISTVPLLTLRNRLAIIPQDPVLFQGTIRFNLNPESDRTDEELWKALEIAQLKQVIADLDMQLDADVSEEGDNFSVGQRQLICLARAFLRKAHVLVMDEATASIDLKTDNILQSVIATAFADRTVITVAHRISTILDSDVVLVLSDGKVIEYDTPHNLLKKEDSMFASLVIGSADQ